MRSPGTSRFLALSCVLPISALFGSESEQPLTLQRAFEVQSQAIAATQDDYDGEGVDDLLVRAVRLISGADGQVAVPDAIYLVTYRFLDGPPAAAPFPTCGRVPGLRLEDCPPRTSSCP